MIEKNNKSFFFKIEEEPDKLLSYLGKNNILYYNNLKSNHKEGMNAELVSYQQIPDQDVRNLLVNMATRYKYLRKKML